LNIPYETRQNSAILAIDDILPPMILCYLQPKLETEIHHGNKVILLFSARQVGKTTLVPHLLAQLPYRSLRINADEQRLTSFIRLPYVSWPSNTTHLS
jgi:predicted AAA+ superfamily ATPase